MHVFLFDIDGTLLASGGAGKAAIEAALVDDFGLPGLQHQVKYSGRTDRAIIRDLLGLHGIEETPEAIRRLLDGYLRRLPDSLNRHRGQVLPGIGPLLDRIRRHPGAALGLLTGNVRAGARLKLGHYGLYDYFACGGFGDHHFDRDAVAHEALAAVRATLGRAVPSDQVWVIGDTPLDVRCARAIGARAAAVATGWHSVEELAATSPDLLFRDLSDPGPLVAALT